MKKILLGIVLAILVMKPQAGVAVVDLIGHFFSSFARALSNDTPHVAVIPTPVNRNYGPDNTIRPIIVRPVIHSDESNEEHQQVQSQPHIVPVAVYRQQQKVDDRLVSTTQQSFQYQQQRVAILEDFVQYHGNDPIVRKRLNLPPKPTPPVKQKDVSVVEFDVLYNKKFRKE